MEADADSYIQVLGRAMGVQLKRGGRDYMSKVGNFVEFPKMWKFRETVDLNLLELVDSRPTSENPAWDQTRPSAGF